MYRGTTPVLIINVEGDFPFAQITALQLDIACTLSRVRKGKDEVTWDEANNRLLCQLSQEDTLHLSGTLQVQMRYQFASGQTFATNIASTSISSIISNNILGTDEVEGTAPIIEAVTLTTQPSEEEVLISIDYGTIIGGGGSTEWGLIEGDINNQSDLKERLLSLQASIGNEAIERVTEDTELAQRISLKQDKIDSNLQTEAITVVGAINELSTNLFDEGQARMNADNALSQELEGKVDNYVGNPTINGTYCYVYAKNGTAFANGARLLSNSALYGGGKDDRNTVVQRTGLNINTADATLDSHVPSWGQTKSRIASDIEGKLDKSAITLNPEPDIIDISIDGTTKQLDASLNRNNVVLKTSSSPDVPYTELSTTNGEQYISLYVGYQVTNGICYMSILINTSQMSAAPADFEDIPLSLPAPRGVGNNGYYLRGILYRIDHSNNESLQYRMRIEDGKGILSIRKMNASAVHIGGQFSYMCE